MKSVTMIVSIPSLLAIEELLWHIRLGSRNIYEEQISQLVKLLEEAKAADPKLEDEMHKYEPPKLHFEFSEDEGFVINIL